MLIQVHYPDDRFDFVKDHILQGLIESKAIVEFKRSSGWVTIGLDPVRQFNRGSHQIPDFNFDHKPADDVKNMIRVVYKDNHHDYVSEELLVNLIESHKIAKFMLPTGWVSVAGDPMIESTYEHNYRYPSELKTQVV